MQRIATLFYSDVGSTMGGAAAGARWRAVSSAVAEAHTEHARATKKSLRSNFEEAAAQDNKGKLHALLCQRALAFQSSSRDLFVGFDVSARCTGIAVVDAMGRGVMCRACETHQEVNVVKVGVRLKTELDNLLEEVGPFHGISNNHSHSGHGWHVGVEECAKSFTRGRFNAKGLVKLAQINGIVQYMCMEQFGETPLLVHPASARAFFDLNGQFMSREPKCETSTSTADVKERVFNFVQGRETADTWVSNSKQKSRLDISDAYLIAWYIRARHIFSVLKEDDDLWPYFGIEIDKLRPVKVRREVECVQEKLLWNWMRAHKDSLGL